MTGIGEDEGEGLISLQAYPKLSRFGGIREKLSEAEPSSDRFEGKGAKAVRSRAKFRQV